MRCRGSAAIGQKVWPPVVRFARRRIEGRDGGRHPAGAGHAQEARRVDGVNRITLSRLQLPPRPPARHTARRWSAGDLDFLQFASREEPDEPAVGRPEWERPAFVPGIGVAARAATGRSQIVPGLGAGDEHDVPAIRRHRHLCGDARASNRRTSKRRVLRRRDRELHRAGCGHDLAGAGATR